MHTCEVARSCACARSARQRTHIRPYTLYCLHSTPWEIHRTKRASSTDERAREGMRVARSRRRRWLGAARSGSDWRTTTSTGARSSKVWGKPAESLPVGWGVIIRSVQSLCGDVVVEAEVRGWSVEGRRGDVAVEAEVRGWSVGSLERDERLGGMPRVCGLAEGESVGPARRTELA